MVAQRYYSRGGLILLRSNCPYSACLISTRLFWGSFQLYPRRPCIQFQTGPLTLMQTWCWILLQNKLLAAHSCTLGKVFPHALGFTMCTAHLWYHRQCVPRAWWGWWCMCACAALLLTMLKDVVFRRFLSTKNNIIIFFFLLINFIIIIIIITWVLQETVSWCLLLLINDSKHQLTVSCSTHVSVLPSLLLFWVDLLFLPFDFDVLTLNSLHLHPNLLFYFKIPWQHCMYYYSDHHHLLGGCYMNYDEKIILLLLLPLLLFFSSATQQQTQIKS